MSIDIENKVPVYINDGIDVDMGDDPEHLIVKSHKRHGYVLIGIGSADYIADAADLIKAVNNATNT